MCRVLLLKGEQETRVRGPGLSPTIPLVSLKTSACATRKEQLSNISLAYITWMRTFCVRVLQGSVRRTRDEFRIAGLAPLAPRSRQCWALRYSGRRCNDKGMLLWNRRISWREQLLSELAGAGARAADSEESLLSHLAFPLLQAQQGYERISCDSQCSLGPGDVSLRERQSLRRTGH